jgi:hypothetical protein
MAPTPPIRVYKTEESFESRRASLFSFQTDGARGIIVAARQSRGSRRRRSCSETACGADGRRAAETRCSRGRSCTTCGCSRSGCLHRQLADCGRMPSGPELRVHLRCSYVLKLGSRRSHSGLHSESASMISTGWHPNSSKAL